MLATRFSKNATSYRSDSPLGESQMAAVAPSIFAVAKHDSRSDRYAHIPTIDVVRALGREGFLPFMVAQSKCRIPGKTDFTKHLIRFRHADKVIGAEAHEVILVNSHDGSSSYQMIDGIFRFVCLNGMVCGDIANDVRIKHKGDVTRDVIDAAFRVIDRADANAETVDVLKQIALRPEETQVFARAAMALRFGQDENTGDVVAPVTAEQVLQARRVEDRGNSLWTTFNRVQENLVRGGLTGRSANGRQQTTREVQSIDRNVSVNRALWMLAEGMKNLKQGKPVTTEELVAA